MLTLYNTLTKHLESAFSTSPEPVKFYSCGPTVYNYVHIGNLRSFIFADLVTRAISHSPTQKVNWVMNITDVDDKTIRDTIQKYGPKATVEDLRKFTDVYLESFISELKQLNVDTANITFIRVADSIPQIQDFILQLIDKNYAYIADDGSTYFSIEKYQKDFGDYGELVGAGFLEGKKVGARVKVDEYDKENLSDFALWKAHTEADANIFWEHDKLGKGRPGWHIECSVINFIGFGGPTDIHTGGIDLAFPHHTNEIAQSQPFYKPFSRVWAHGAHLIVDGAKMSKSLGNVYTLEDLQKRDSNAANIFRYQALQVHYRAPMNFTWEAFDAAKTALNRLYEFMRTHSAVPANEPKSEIKNQIPNQTQPNTQAYEQRFLESINDDLNTPKALAVIWELLGDKNISDTNKKSALLSFDTVLGLNLEHPPVIHIPEEIKNLAHKRDEARKNKDYEKSDELRKQIEQHGFEVLDTPDGTKIQ